MIQLFVCAFMTVSWVLPHPSNAQQQHATKSGNSAASTPSAGALPANFMLAKQPEGAKWVEEAKETAKTGDKVLIRGRIGGSTAPFVEGRAVFTLMGDGIKACSTRTEDKCCNTPWDYCCETAEAIAKHSATIQVVDADGVPLRTGLKGIGGMKELSEVIVQGTVKEAKGKVLIVNSTGIFVVKP